MKSLLLRHAQVLVAGLGRLCRHPLSSLLTLGGIGVALAVPLTLYVLVQNLSSVFGDFGDTPRMSIYVDRDAGERAAGLLADRLRDDTQVDRVTLIPRDQGLAQLFDLDALAPLRGRLVENPLPDVLEVMPIAGLDEGGYRELAARLARMDGVGDVQIDLAWVARLRAVTELVAVVVQVFWVLLLGGVAMVISNSVRLSLVTAREEIEVISLVGGSEAFIRRPFLYSGTLQGVIGALVAVVVAMGVHVLVAPALSRLMEAYLGMSTVSFASASTLANVVVASGSLGWLASWITVSRYLRQVLPR